jgi:hypothetical protein
VPTASSAFKKASVSVLALIKADWAASRSFKHNLKEPCSKKIRMVPVDRVDPSGHLTACKKSMIHVKEHQGGCSWTDGEG